MIFPYTGRGMGMRMFHARKLPPQPLAVLEPSEAANDLATISTSQQLLFLDPYQIDGANDDAVPIFPNRAGTDSTASSGGALSFDGIVKFIKHRQSGALGAYPGILGQAISAGDTTHVFLVVHIFDDGSIGAGDPIFTHGGTRSIVAASGNLFIAGNNVGSAPTDGFQVIEVVFGPSETKWAIDGGTLTTIAGGTAPSDSTFQLHAWRYLNFNSAGVVVFGAEQVSQRERIVKRLREMAGLGDKSPVFIAIPLITGTPEVGTELTLDIGAAIGQPTPTLTPTLTLAGADVTNDMSATGDPAVFAYVPTETGPLVLSVVAANGIGSDKTEQASTTVVPEGAGTMRLMRLPAITGVPEPGETLTLDEGEFQADPAPTLTTILEWNGTDVTANMVGATYTVPAGEKGALKYTVTATNGVAFDRTEYAQATIQSAERNEILFGALTFAGHGGIALPGGATAISDNGGTGLEVVGGDIVPAANGVVSGTLTFDDASTAEVVAVEDRYSVRTVPEAKTVHDAVGTASLAGRGYLMRPGSYSWSVGGGWNMYGSWGGLTGTFVIEPHRPEDRDLVVFGGWNPGGNHLMHRDITFFIDGRNKETSGNASLFSGTNPHQKVVGCVFDGNLPKYAWTGADRYFVDDVQYGTSSTGAGDILLDTPLRAGTIATAIAAGELAFGQSFRYIIEHPSKSTEVADAEIVDDPTDGPTLIRSAKTNSNGVDQEVDASSKVSFLFNAKHFNPPQIFAIGTGSDIYIEDCLFQRLSFAIAGQPDRSVIRNNEMKWGWADFINCNRPCDYNLVEDNFLHSHYGTLFRHPDFLQIIGGGPVGDVVGWEIYRNICVEGDGSGEGGFQFTLNEGTDLTESGNGQVYRDFKVKGNIGYIEVVHGISFEQAVIDSEIVGNLMLSNMDGTITNNNFVAIRGNGNGRFGAETIIQNNVANGIFLGSNPEFPVHSGNNLLIDPKVMAEFNAAFADTTNLKPVTKQEVLDLFRPRAGGPLDGTGIGPVGTANANGYVNWDARTFNEGFEDFTKPTLTGSSLDDTSESTLNGTLEASILTDIGTGTLYGIALPSAESAPGYLDLLNGTAKHSQSSSVSAAGSQLLTFAKLFPATEYKVYYLHQAQSGMLSTISETVPITTANWSDTSLWTPFAAGAEDAIQYTDLTPPSPSASKIVFAVAYRPTADWAVSFPFAGGAGVGVGARFDGRFDFTWDGARHLPGFGSAGNDYLLLIVYDGAAQTLSRKVIQIGTSDIAPQVSAIPGPSINTTALGSLAINQGATSSTYPGGEFQRFQLWMSNDSAFETDFATVAGLIIDADGGTFNLRPKDVAEAALGTPVISSAGTELAVGFNSAL